MEISAHPHQAKVLQSNARIIAAISGVQGGKTMTGAMWLLREIVNHPKDDFLILAPTYKILEQSTLRKVFELFPAGTYVYKKQESVLQIIGGGKVFIRSTEKPDTIEGMTVRAAWLDEAGLMKSRTWVNIHARVAAKQGKILLTTTPYNAGWVFKDVVRPWQAGDQDIEVVQWRSVDPPYFPKEEYERAKLRLAPDEFERRYNGQFKKMEGLVYPDWDATTMTVQLPPASEFQTVFAGVDYGFSNPTAIIVVGVTKENRIYVLDEIYKTRLTINDIVNEARELKERWGIQYFYADPSAPSLIETLNQNALACAPANNDVDVGIARVRQLIKNHRVKIVSSCYNLIDEIEIYHYNPNAYSEAFPEYKAKPDKVFDHACLVGDTLITTSEGDKRLDQINIGDQVLTRQGVKPVANWGMTKENAEIYQVRFSNGTILNGTHDHPVYVMGKGMTTIDALRYGDTIIACKTQLPLTIENTIGTADTISVLSPQMIKLPDIDYTVTSGSTITDPSQSATISITKTATGATTTLPTSNVSLSSNISEITLTPTPPDLSGDEILLKPAYSQLNGINRQLEESSINDLESSLGKINPLSLPSVPFVEDGTALTSQTDQSSAIQTVKPPLFDQDVQVIEVVPLNITSPVYNITVEDAHEYFANGVLVSNCDAMRYALSTHPLEIFDVFTEVIEDRRTEFWKRVEERTKRRTIKIARYGEDYPDEDAEIIESLII